MKANELRLRNWIINKNGMFVPEQVKVINGTWVNLLDENQWSGVPLSEEWLVKAGFTDDGWDYWNGPKYFELAKLDDGTWVNSINCHEYDNGEPIKYVHQLQNLYFALTGEELEFKL